MPLGVCTGFSMRATLSISTQSYAAPHKNYMIRHWQMILPETEIQDPAMGLDYEKIGVKLVCFSRDFIE
ncbi:MAG: hypothetical protein ACLUGP_03120 [Faecalibacterium prausnitzii]